MKIRDLMTLYVEALDPDASVREAARVMRDIDAGAIPIVEDERVVGVLTDRDIVLRAVAEGLDPAETRVADIMTEDVILCFEDQEVQEAARLMSENQVRRLVVLNRERKLVGILSLGDLAEETGDERMTGRILERICEPSGQFEPQGTASVGGASMDMGKESYGDDNISYLVKDELAAVETYRQALEKLGQDQEAGAELKRIESEHEEAVALLQEHMAEIGAQPPTSSGVWGIWAKAVEGTAKALGNKAAIKALKEGEEHGVHDYEDALRDESLNFQLKELISTNLLPKTRSHIPVLDRFLQAVSE